MKPAVLFDFDGTLFYGTTDINYYAMNLALREMGRAPITREMANSTVGDKIPDVCRRILGTDDEGLCQTFYDGIFRYAPQAIEEHAYIEPDCVDMLWALAERAPIAICSNAERVYLMTLLEKFRIKDLFSYVWHSRPGYNKASAIPELKKILGVQQAIMVGDRAEDVHSGKQNGCVCVAMQNDFGARDAIGADYDVLDYRQMKEVILKLISEMEDLS